MILYIQGEMKTQETVETNSPTKQSKPTEKKTKGVYVRLSESEQKQLKLVSHQSGVNVSQLLRTGALGQLDQLPRFRKLPAEVVAQLSKLDRLTTALWYISQRADQEDVYAADIREMVYSVGQITAQVNQYCQSNVARYGTTAQLDALINHVREWPLPADLLVDIVERLQTIRDSFATNVK